MNFEVTFYILKLQCNITEIHPIMLPDDTFSDNETKVESNSTGKIKYLNAPFEQEDISYHCECESCILSKKYISKLPKLFFGGIVLPLFWFVNIALFIYAQCLTSHDVTHSSINEEELPTLYEIELYKKRSMFKKPVTSKYIIEDHFDITSDTTSSKSHYRSPSTSSSIELELHRSKHLRNIAMDIIRSHDTVRKCYTTWTLRSILAIFSYCIAVSLIFVICQYS